RPGSSGRAALRVPSIAFGVRTSFEILDPKLVVADHLAGLDRVSIVELLATAALRLAMFRLLLPHRQRILVREADQVDLFPVLARVRLDRDESGNLLDELVHATRGLPVGLRVRALPQMGLEDYDDFGRVLYIAIRHASPLLGPSRPARRALLEGLSFAALIRRDPPCGRRACARTTFRPQRTPSHRRVRARARPIGRRSPS